MASENLSFTIGYIPEDWNGYSGDHDDCYVRVCGDDTVIKEIYIEVSQEYTQTLGEKNPVSVSINGKEMFKAEYFTFFDLSSEATQKVVQEIQNALGVGERISAELLREANLALIDELEEENDAFELIAEGEDNVDGFFNTNLEHNDKFYIRYLQFEFEEGEDIDVWEAKLMTISA